MADRDVHIRLYVDLHIKADDDVEIAQFIDEAEVEIRSPFADAGRLDVKSADIMNYEITDSR